MRYLPLGASINTFDLAIALRGQTGTFLVKPTNGGEEVYDLLVTCENGSITNFEWANAQKYPFTVTKIAEPTVATIETKPAMHPVRATAAG